MIAMYDSVDPRQIPAHAQAVAGYVAGHFPTFPVLEREFPHARRLSIAVASTQDADCLDVEPGDSRPELAPGWVKRQHARGVHRPVVYASRDAMPAVIHALQATGIKRADVRLWSAHFTGHAHLCSPACGATFHADATQWTNRSLGRNLDESLCHPDFFALPAEIALWQRRVKFRQDKREHWAKLLTEAQHELAQLEGHA